jgi:hypothetical protein
MNTLYIILGVCFFLSFIFTCGDTFHSKGETFFFISSFLSAIFLTIFFIVSSFVQEDRVFVKEIYELSNNPLDPNDLLVHEEGYYYTTYIKKNGFVERTSFLSSHTTFRDTSGNSYVEYTYSTSDPLSTKNKYFLTWFDGKKSQSCILYLNNE